MENTADAFSPVVNTLLNQLGRRCLLMLGASTFVATETSVHFVVKGTRKASKVLVRYEPGDDLYTVEFYKGKGLGLTLVHTDSLVYADQLRAVISAFTGLATKL